MATVKSLPLAGKSVNVPHTEHLGEDETAVVRFAEDGTAEVSDVKAQALAEFYPSQVEVVAKPKTRSRTTKTTKSE